MLEILIYVPTRPIDMGEYEVHAPQYIVNCAPIHSNGSLDLLNEGAEVTTFLLRLKQDKLECSLDYFLQLGQLEGKILQFTAPIVYLQETASRYLRQVYGEADSIATIVQQRQQEGIIPTKYYPHKGAGTPERYVDYDALDEATRTRFRRYWRTILAEAILMSGSDSRELYITAEHIATSARMACPLLWPGLHLRVEVLPHVYLDAWQKAQAILLRTSEMKG